MNGEAILYFRHNTLENHMTVKNDVDYIDYKNR